MKTQNKIPRFDAVERAVHWLVAITFIYAALSGLSMWSRKLYWISAVLGGGVTVRAMHPIIALMFAAAFTRMYFKWKQQMNLDADDKVWLANSHKYAINEEAGLPEPGKFNAGQKMMFWMQARPHRPSPSRATPQSAALRYTVDQRTMGRPCAGRDRGCHQSAPATAARAHLAPRAGLT